MAFVITRLCRDCVDGACVDICPVACIVEHRPADGESLLPNQLFIDPGECIHCLLCEPVCPWDAIYDEAQVPDEFSEDIALNAQARQRDAGFHVPLRRLVERAAPEATPEAVARNKETWGLQRG
jgi:ferredoxin